MGGQSPFYFAAMDSNTIIGKTQHVRHRCIVEIGNMVFILLHNGEGAQRSRLVIGPIKNDGGPYFIAGAENRECLCGKINGDDHGTIRNTLVVPNIIAVLERPIDMRSEEHTSELQSLMRISYAVFCLKKKKNINHIKQTTKLN